MDGEIDRCWMVAWMERLMDVGFVDGWMVVE